MCLASDILCTACAKKVESGEITDSDLKISRALYKAGGKAVEFINVIDTPRMSFVIVDKKHVKDVIGKGGRTSKELEKALGKKVRIIEKGDKKEMAENILGVPVIAINVLYAGTEKYKIRVDKKMQSRIRKEYVEVLDSLLDKHVQMAFE